MSEIEPQFENLPSSDLPGGAKLTEAMRRLAASSRQGAPAEIGADLATAFRRHHTRRRRIRYASMAGLVACVACVAGLLFLHGQHNTSREGQSQIAQAPVNQASVNQHPANQAGTETSSLPAKAHDAAAITLPVQASSRPVRRRTPPKATTSTYSRQFLALPGYDPAVPADELHVVRVRMSSNTLWQMGAPVNPDGVGRRVMADFVVSQDGTPYAVRLVQ
jgi:hypothetical protein